MDEENQIEYLIKEIINMIKAGKTSSEIHRFYKPYLPDYMVYNAYHAANILLKDTLTILLLKQKQTNKT
jgi:hypothetical protein